MSSWIDTANSQYPWAEPLARDLHKRLVESIFDPPDVRNLVQRAHAPDWTRVNWNGSPRQVWVSVLDQAGRENSLRELLEFIAAEERAIKPLAAFVDELLADKRPPADPGASGQDAADFDGAVTKQEALLFGDDLSESVGEIPDLLAAVERVMKWRSVVCRLVVTGADGQPYAGTGTLLSGNRVLTNHHVLFPDKQRRQCTAARVEFNYENDARGQSLASTVVDGDVASIRSDAADDWGVITVAPPVSIVPMDLAANVAAPVASERAFILQHPGGDPKRLAFVRNRIASVTDRRVYYLTDTKAGSSGSPVFDARGKLIALHRAGGDPQKLTGVDPVKKNEGVRMDAIAASVGGP